MHTSNHLKSIKLPTIIGNGVELVKENSGTRDFCTHIQKFFFFFFFFFTKDHVHICTTIHPNTKSFTLFHTYIHLNSVTHISKEKEKIFTV